MDKMFDVLVNVSVRLVKLKLSFGKIKYTFDLFTYSLPQSRYGRFGNGENYLSLK